MSEAPNGNATGNRAAGPAAVRDVVAYAVARLVLAVAVSAAIYGVARLLGVTDFPLVVAALFGLIIAMPLGIWVFTPLRRRATDALAVTGERRRKEREDLRARLRGEASADDADDET